MKKVYAQVKKRAIDLSLSENPLGSSPLVFTALKSLEPNFNAYPSANGGLLKMSLAKKFSIEKDKIFIANGSESIINDLPRIFCNKGDEVLVPALSFPLFAICSELVGAKVIRTKMGDNLEIDLAAILKAISEKTKLVFICNPNNPTGAVLAKEELLDFIKNCPQTVLVVLDEANIEFGGDSLLSELNAHNNLIILRTFSKGFGLASLRVGFAIASKVIVEKMEAETPVFQISALSEQLAGVALKDDNFLEKSKQFVKDQRDFLKKELEELDFIVFPSQANNLFVKIPSFLSATQFTTQLKNKEISLVEGSNFVGFDNSFFRLSVRDKKTNQLFIKKMTEITRKAFYK